MEKMFDIRFIVPPIVGLFFVFLFSPLETIGYLTENPFEGLLGISTTILAMGFILSSIIDQPFRKKVFPGEKEKMFYQINYFTDSFPVSKGLGDLENNLSAHELGTWLVMSELDDDHLKEQIHKRWHMVNANFNSVLALLVAFFVVCVFYAKNVFVYVSDDWATISYPCLWSIMFSIFLTNGLNALCSITKMHELLCVNLDRIKSRLPHK